MSESLISGLPRSSNIILALDRISQFEIKEETFHREPDVNLEVMFDGVFGITIGDGDVESVWLKVEAHQANYLRSLPLHRSCKHPLFRTVLNWTCKGT